ncbi:ABC transporter ATP-binding protein [Paenibacillus physcomitrellae]|uniref:ABC transporter ATP-binding protein n=1 Tax=Paenibacillus physcomitrellae TaxID=1619311 RepID=A0ABQ1FQR7_9BACL|nr:ABC transporter ATP-binding protein [Paenibacillus physcomitrellae]GGA27010.1 ABC transporter ATP-binding protein [Paenibacillus physcomitrellae]
MAFIFTFLNKYRVAAVSAFVMMLVELAVELIQPYLISKIIDDGIRVQQLSVVWLWGGVLVVSAVLAFLAGVSSSFFASHTSQGFAYDLRDRLYNKVQSFSYSVFGRFAESSLITRLTGDITVLQDMIFMSLRFATRVPLVVAGSMIMALVVNVKLGLFLTVMVPLLFVFAFFMMKATTRQFRKAQRRLDDVNGIIQENLVGIRLIRVFVRMGHEVERFSQMASRLMNDTIKALRLTETTTPFILLMINAAVIVILWMGRVDIHTGSATVGEVVAVINYSLRVTGALSALSWIMASYSRAGASAQRVSEVLDTESDEAMFEEQSEADRTSGSASAVGESRSTGRPDHLANRTAAPSDVSVQIPRFRGAVEFREVGFRYPGSEVQILEQISFAAEPGQTIAIMGATGSGKSSLVQLIPGLHKPTEGNLIIDGQEISALDVSQLRKAIGYVPQEIVLFGGTIRENIAWGREDATLEQIRQAARRAQIHKTIEHLPLGYDTMLGQRGINLSGGQKQRLSIARALVREPAILILDDSTSALDLRTEAALLNALKELSCTTFLITQKISSTRSADLILLLDEGRLIAKGRHEQLLADSSLYRRICESQNQLSDADLTGADLSKAARQEESAQAERLQPESDNDKREGAAHVQNLR